MIKDDINENIKNIYKNFQRLKSLSWIFALCFLTITGRLFYLQVIKGDYYKKLAYDNCMHAVKNRASRGYIFDRNYRKLVTNISSNTFSITPFYFNQNKDREGAIAEIAKMLGLDADLIKSKMEKNEQNLFEPVVIKRDISAQELAALKEKSSAINGLSIEQEPKRSYPYKSLASHTIGYVGEINEDQLKMQKYEGYSGGDIIGQTGIENTYDAYLRGEDGSILILTDAMGRQKQKKDELQSKKGKDLVLTIDSKLQRYAESVMDESNRKGVILMEEVKTGEILCMVSKPDYDLNYFSGRIDSKEWKKLLRDKNNPLNDRVVQGLYSPGSIFKVAVGTGGLNENVIDANTSFQCDGRYWIKTWPYKCWKSNGHGWVSFYKAVAESCDIFFYKLGLKMKVELLNKYALMFGLSQKTEIDLPGEKAGLVPSREWKQRVERSEWFPGNTVMMSIGQGYLIATPLQIMNIMATIANSGYCMVPHVAKAITLDDGSVYKNIEPRHLFDLNVKPEVIKMMRTALRMVVGSYAGTAKKASVPGIKVSGKTATVQNPHGETHAMFAGFAPYDDPEIVIYVLVEHGGGGGDVAAPIASRVMEYYFKTLRAK
jgi:penicillin-binding protein 2